MQLYVVGQIDLPRVYDLFSLLIYMFSPLIIEMINVAFFSLILYILIYKNLFIRTLTLKTSRFKNMLRSIPQAKKALN